VAIVVYPPGASDVPADLPEAVEDELKVLPLGNGVDLGGSTSPRLSRQVFMSMDRRSTNLRARAVLRTGRAGTGTSGRGLGLAG
jgi:hypothetical protein